MQRASQFHPAKPVKGSRRCHVWGHLRWHWQIDACRANCRVSCSDSRLRFLPRKLPSKSNSTAETDRANAVAFLAANQSAAHDLAPNCIFVEPFCDPRYSLHIWSSTFPPCARTFIRSFIRSFGKKATESHGHVYCTHPWRDHLAGFRAHPVHSHALIYKPKRLNAVIKF